MSQAMHSVLDWHAGPRIAASIGIHCYIIWELIGADVRTSIVTHAKGMLLYKGFSLAMLAKSRELEIKDISNPENESEFREYTRKTNMDKKKRFFVIHGLLAAEWKYTAMVIFSQAMIGVARNWRRLLFVSIISYMSNPDSAGISGIAGSLIVWQILAFTSLCERYLENLQNNFSKRIEALLYTKAVEFYLESHSESYGVWEFESKIQNITYAHQLLSRSVNRKIDRLRKKQRKSKVPRFQDNYYYTFRNIRTIKFYGWESAFQSSRGWIDNEFYSPPIFWRVAKWVILVVGSATSQISAALTIISYFSVSSTAISYADISLLISSIDSLTSFTDTITGIGETVTRSLVDTSVKSYIVHKPKADLASNVAIELNDCVFTWGEDKFTLKPVSMRIKQGEFVTIVGRVGGGKSSFVSGLCGEMAISSGSGHIYGKVGYVSQKPFIMNTTFRENVTMNAEYDEKLMDRVLKACVLLDDIKTLPAGDLTEIGSNGVNLSGGQKVRLALARALYLDADVYIFDDLLSAVDTRVERLLIERVLSSGGIIGNKTRVLVTHAEHVVPLSCKVITFTDGTADIVEQEPADLVISSKSTSSEDDEISDKIKSPNKQKAEFTIHPELKDPVLRMPQILRFAKMSGYGIIAVVLGFELVRACILHYTEGLRIKLMTDSNPETIRQSLTKYLIVNAALTIGGLQLIIFNQWIRETLWSKNITKLTRTNLINTILSLPLPTVEQLSHVTLVDMFIVDRHRICNSLPRLISNDTVLQVLMAISAILQAMRTSPFILILCLPSIIIKLAQRKVFSHLWDKLWKIRVKHIDGPSNQVTMTLLGNRALLRVHGSVVSYMDRFKSVRSAAVSYYTTRNVIYNSFYLLSYICTEITRNSVLGFKLWQRFYMGIPIQSGEVDALSRLSFNTVNRVARIATLFSGQEEELQALARYFIYTEKLVCEAPSIIEDCRPPSSWPESGVVEFCDYSMRYRSELDLVLKGLTFSTVSSEKIGIVGRTGAGKSSITYALMRMVEPASGQIKIDGIDISTIGIRDLRSQIAIIPQDPTLFEGTIRDNLDPTHEYSDDDIWAAIRAGKIEGLLEKPTEKYVEKTTKDDDDDDNENADKGPWTEGIGLNKWVEYNGNNFSVGQRQLVSLCRALLWRRKVVVLDEATANVDGETDKIMQEVIRREFKNCTVLTIAHRLGTIMDNDRILVMDQGQAVEFDTPQNLLADKDSIFSRLVENMKTVSNN
ncbi:ATPase-like protein [Coemansia sp. RSA 2703]|nr:ATPase-like protein [Coemansia sp. RSA 2703]